MNADQADKRPEQIEREIEHTRAAVSSTIDAIQRKLTPGQLMDQALDYFRNSGPADFGANLGQTVRDNPVPVTLIGVGLAWLMMSGKSPGRSARHAGDYYGHNVHEAGRSGSAEGALHRAGASASEMGHQVKDKAAELGARAGDMMGSARERIAHTASETRTRMQDIGGRSREQYERAKSSFAHIVEEQPLVLGALGLAVGAALGASLPATRREDQLMGRTRDDLVEGARETAREQVQAVKETTRQVADAVSDEASASSGREPRPTADTRGQSDPTPPVR